MAISGSSLPALRKVLSTVTLVSWHPAPLGDRAGTSLHLVLQSCKMSQEVAAASQFWWRKLQISGLKCISDWTN